MEDKSSYREHNDKKNTKNLDEPGKIKYNENQIESLNDDVEWDGSESELVIEEDNEEYEENLTGIKLKYILEEKEIIQIFKHTENYHKNSKMQKNHTIIQIVLFVILVLLWIFMGNVYYAMLTFLPLICIGIIWFLPYISLKKLAKEFFSGEEISLEVFPDKICVNVKDKHREIPLDGTAEFEELIEMIIVNPNNQNTLIIPIRAIEPEFLPDVQAMITAGTHPKYKE